MSKMYRPRIINKILIYMLFYFCWIRNNNSWSGSRKKFRIRPGLDPQHCFLIVANRGLPLILCLQLCETNCLELLNTAFRYNMRSLQKLAADLFLRWGVFRVFYVLKWQCHEIYWHFFHEKNPPGPLINNVKWFRWDIREISDSMLTNTAYSLAGFFLPWKRILNFLNTSKLLNLDQHLYLL